MLQTPRQALASSATAPCGIGSRGFPSATGARYRRACADPRYFAVGKKHAGVASADRCAPGSDRFRRCIEQRRVGGRSPTRSCLVGVGGPSQTHCRRADRGRWHARGSARAITRRANAVRADENRAREKWLGSAPGPTAGVQRPLAVTMRGRARVHRESDTRARRCARSGASGSKPVRQWATTAAPIRGRPSGPSTRY
jgi:hypothetical protein